MVKKSIKRKVNWSFCLKSEIYWVLRVETFWSSEVKLAFLSSAKLTSRSQQHILHRLKVWSLSELSVRKRKEYCLYLWKIPSRCFVDLCFNEKAVKWNLQQSNIKHPKVCSLNQRKHFLLRSMIKLCQFVFFIISKGFVFVSSIFVVTLTFPLSYVLE